MQRQRVDHPKPGPAHSEPAAPQRWNLHILYPMGCLELESESLGRNGWMHTALLQRGHTAENQAWASLGHCLKSCKGPARGALSSAAGQGLLGTVPGGSHQLSVHRLQKFSGKGACPAHLELLPAPAADLLCHTGVCRCYSR